MTRICSILIRQLECDISTAAFHFMLRMMSKKWFPPHAGCVASSIFVRFLLAPWAMKSASERLCNVNPQANTLSLSVLFWLHYRHHHFSFKLCHRALMAFEVPDVRSLMLGVGVKLQMFTAPFYSIDNDDWSIYGAQSHPSMCFFHFISYNLNLLSWFYVPINSALLRFLSISSISPPDPKICSEMQWWCWITVPLKVRRTEGLFCCYDIWDAFTCLLSNSHPPTACHVEPFSVPSLLASSCLCTSILPSSTDSWVVFSPGPILHLWGREKGKWIWL